jgi:hypothetical protein
MNVTEIIAALGRLTANDRAKVQAALNTLGIKHEPVVDDWLLEGIEWELKRRKLLGQRGTLKHHPLYANYRKKAGAVREVLLQSMPNATRQERHNLGALAGSAYCKGLEDYGLYPKTLLSGIDRLPAIFDNAFPGYLHNGGVRFLIADMSSVGNGAIK